jgi:hypothetical protein
MGGAFSGRNDYATTPTVEACRSLDINWLHQEGCLDVGASGSIRWSEDDEQVASLSYRIVSNGESRAVILSYTMVDHRTGDSEEHEYSIPIETTACNFGGERPWFRCPGVVDGELVVDGDSTDDNIDILREVAHQTAFEHAMGEVVVH